MADIAEPCRCPWGRAQGGDHRAARFQSQAGWGGAVRVAVQFPGWVLGVFQGANKSKIFSNFQFWQIVPVFCLISEKNFKKSKFGTKKFFQSCTRLSIQFLMKVFDNQKIFFQKFNTRQYTAEFSYVTVNTVDKMKLLLNKTEVYEVHFFRSALGTVLKKREGVFRHGFLKPDSKSFDGRGRGYKNIG